MVKGFGLERSLFWQTALQVFCTRYLHNMQLFFKDVKKQNLLINTTSSTTMPDFD